MYYHKSHVYLKKIKIIIHVHCNLPVLLIIFDQTLFKSVDFMYFCHHYVLQYTVKSKLIIEVRGDYS